MASAIIPDTRRRQEFYSALEMVFGCITLIFFFQLQWTVRFHLDEWRWVRIFGAIVGGFPAAMIYWSIAYGIAKLVNTSATKALHLAVYGVRCFYPLWLFSFALYLAPVKILSPIFMIVSFSAMLLAIGAGSFLLKEVPGAPSPSFRLLYEQQRSFIMHLAAYSKEPVAGGYFKLYRFTALLWIAQCMLDITTKPLPNMLPMQLLLPYYVLPYLFIAVAVHAIKSLSGTRSLAFVLSTGFLLVEIVLMLYYRAERIHLDFAALASNSDSLFDKNSIETVADRLGSPEIAILSILSVVIVLLEIRYRLLSCRFHHPVRIRAGIVNAGVALVILAMPINKNDELSMFLHTVYNYFRPPASYAGFEGRGRYPLFSYPVKTTQVSGERPDIIVVSLESFSGRYLFAKTSDGREIMPCLNEVSSGALFPVLFYGNSIQTAKGHFAILTGLPPSVHRKELADYTDVKYRSLATILREAGYGCVFLQSYENINFDQTGFAMRKLGFSKVITSRDIPMTREERAMRYGWGIRDDVFLRRSIDFLSKEYKGQPVFAFLITISHHSKFNKVPRDLCLYPDATDRTQCFLNSLHAADSYLCNFMQEIDRNPRFRNAIIVLVSDHSYPAGEHALYHNETGYYEEFFRSVCMLRWKNHLFPRKLDQMPYSQLDIAPTLLDLAGIQTPNHFVGVSMLKTPAAPRTIPLVQPYAGTYVISLRYPYKYVKHEATGNRYVYNIKDDPAETKNLVTSMSSDSIRLFDNDIQKQYSIEQLMLENRICP